MQSKTPQFDKAIQSMLDDLVPHNRTCLWSQKHTHCENTFRIENEDITFLKLFKVPPPNFCPTCRRMRRLVYMGTLNLFVRSCEAPGHTESIISIYSDACPFPVYDYQYFIGDSFDPFIFGVPYDIHKTPLTQLFELRKKFPIPSFLNRDPSSINSDYSNGGRDTKNAYFSSGCFHSEDIWYTAFATKSREIMNSRALYACDMVYQSVFSEHIYKSAYVYFSRNCSTSYFLYDCRNCTDCFGCVNLRNAKYCIFNQQYSKEEFDSFIGKVIPFSRESLDDFQTKFFNLVKTLPMNASRNTTIKDSYGVMLESMGSSYSATQSDNSINVRYADGALTHNDSMDLLFSGGHSHHLYMTINIGSQSSNVKFSISSKFTTDSEFVFNCKNVSNCFMCFGLQNKSYCVLNKQYSPEEYWQLVDTIKTEMLLQGEYGDGFGLEFSAEAYNLSLAQVSFPLTADEILLLGGYIAHEPESNAKDINIIDTGDVPNTIDNVDDSICSQAIRCSETGRPFRVIPTELAFYRKMGLPLPILHPTVRINRNYTLAPMGVIHNVSCASCGAMTPSLYPENSGYLLYCIECYQQAVL